MAIDFQTSLPEVTAEEADAMRAEIRRCIEQIERLHQQMRNDDARAEAAGARRKAMLEQLKADVTAAFGALPG